VYGTATPSAAGPFKVSPLASVSPTALGTGVDAFSAISPDGNWVLGFTQQTLTSLTNTILASTTTPGVPTMLVMQPTSSAIGDSFTTDSKFAIYTDTVVSTMTVSGVVTSGNLNAVAVGRSSAVPMPLGNAVFIEAAGPTSKVVFAQNWTAPANLGFGLADLSAIDLSAPLPVAKTLVSRADASFYLTTDKSTIVYSFSTGGGGQPTSASGLWAMPVP
jgi:hypothetical protein